MRKLLALLLTLALIFSLAACGGGGDEKTPSNEDKTPSSSQQQEDKTPDPDPVEDEPDDKGGNETDADGWPVADYITAGMKYTGAGKIVNAPHGRKMIPLLFGECILMLQVLTRLPHTLTR